MVKKTIFFFIIFISDLSRSCNNLNYNFSSGRIVLDTIQVPVDHFSKYFKTFPVRFYKNSKYFKPGGPMIIYIQGEAMIVQEDIEEGLIVDIAKEHGGILFSIENRYYGESQPFHTWKTEDLRLLTIEQTLKDLAYFIEKTKVLNPELAESKVILIGCSYAATLATWMRLKFPNLADIVWASSAPLEFKINFSEYYEVAGEAIKETSLKCYETLKEAHETLQKLFQTQKGRNYIQSKFNLCTPIPNKFPEKENFFTIYSFIWADVVQRGYIKLECDLLLQGEGTAVEKVAAHSKRKDEPYCSEYSYQKFVNWYKSSEINTEETTRQWFYQLYTELGSFHTTTSANTPFGLNTITSEYYEKLCRDLFGEEFILTLLNNRIKEVNLKYGGKDLNVTNVIFTHGSFDPWHKLGVVKSLNEETSVKLVRGGSHCGDMDSIGEGENLDMKEVKKFVMFYIAKWLQK